MIPSPLIFFLLFSQRLLTYTHVYSIIIDRKEVKTLSKKKQKKSGNKKDQPASTINLITAIVNMDTAIYILVAISIALSIVAIVLSLKRRK